MSKKIKILKGEGTRSLPIFCLNCYQHSWKNCYGKNPCTPVRLLYREYPLDQKSRKAAMTLQELYLKTPFEKQESWGKKVKRFNSQQTKAKEGVNI